MRYTPTEQILQTLIGFATVSRDSNLDLIGFIENYLNELGIQSKLLMNAAGSKANLYATFGPKDKPGIMLSGHTDVVPIDAQNWSVEPFSMSLADERLYGRGSADMKGFIASVLAMLPAAVNANLRQPIHLAFSYDEEIGCVGVNSLLDLLETAPLRPQFCIVGEPTEMQVAIAHKGKTGILCRCHGVESHSALTDKGLNAIYLAAEMIQAIRDLQQTLVQNSKHDHHYNVPYTTLHVGTIEGGTALNIVPQQCSFKFEIRNIKSDNPQQIIARLEQLATQIVADYRHNFPQAEIKLEVFNAYPALDTSPNAPLVKLLQGLMDTDQFIKLAFGTEGGLFQSRLDIATVVCGPGSMQQGHKPDEFIARSELRRCDQFLGKLLQHLS